ncbi:MAG: hypothetical protein KDE35_09450 [Geminicoccaceae bacterium]|nr:hypothetical protein [Geminicoccaceae bacterium]
MERVLSILALLVLCGFLGILFFSVPRFDLGLVIALTLGLAAWEFLVRRERTPGA